VWIGPEYWANPLQDWQVNNGRIECVVSGGNRNVYLLTHELGAQAGNLDMSVRVGQLDKTKKLDVGWVGFRLGVKGEFDDYRDSAVRGKGLNVGMDTAGRLFVGEVDSGAVKIDGPFEDVQLGVTVEPAGDNYSVTIEAFDEKANKLLKIRRDDIGGGQLVGGLALVCSGGKGGNVRFWFADWKISGTKVEVDEERAFGPILFAQHTLSGGVLKMTAQMPPIGDEDSQYVWLEIRKGAGWSEIARAKIDKLARTATFWVGKWDGTKDMGYRLGYELADGGGKVKKYYYEGTVRKEPAGKDEIVVAAFTGNNDLGFPNNDFVKQVEIHNPDLLFFSGDQIYEGVGGFGVQRRPLEKAVIDYLRKWYLYGWAYGDLLKDIPAVSIPDDHDVYHGNIWGAGGKATEKGLGGAKAQDTGGYKMPAAWVNMVQRTQTSHLPDAYDPRPVKQGIGVYYCNMNYGGVSFAILEDRKFKSAPKMLLPEAKINNGWAQNIEFDAKTQGDVAGAELLGDRQLCFLDAWADDWRDGVWMKVVLSQTIFANVATLPASAHHDNVVPGLRILGKGEYPPDDRAVSDFDSNGWPQRGRNKALRIMRKAFAFHIAGDQHLGSTIQYGIDDWHDAGFALCTPSISNVWPRRWYPLRAGANRKGGEPKYTGDFEDGFGNKMTVYAVSNPVFTGVKPARLYDRATGYGIVRFDKATRDITIECWRRLGGDEQYPGWPVKINQLDNYGRKAYGYLPAIKISGKGEPVVQVIDESNGETVYTLRIKGGVFEPKVFGEGTYTVKVGEPGTGEMKIFTGLRAVKDGQEQEIDIVF
jgi:hypothetical protein